MYQPDSKVSEGYDNPKRQKNISKLGKKGPKILHFWTPWAIWWRYGQTALASYTKFGVQVLKGQPHLHTKFWVPVWILSTIFLQKTPIKRLKNQKIVFFCYICSSIVIGIMKFGMNKLVPDMNPHVKSHNPVFSSFRVILFWIFPKICYFWF